MKVLVFTLLFFLIASSEAKIFSRCELASIMKQNDLDGYMGYQLGEWLCFAYYASRYNTQAGVGSSYYGIFQIDSYKWCGNLNRCYKPCSAFTDDDITDDIACAKEIAANHVLLRFWWPWIDNCRGTNVAKWTSGCQL